MTEFTREYFVEKGREGGNATKKKYGKKHYKKIAQLQKGIAKRTKKQAVEP